LRRIGLAVVLAFGLALTPLTAEAQLAAKIARIGYLAATPQLNEAFSQGMRDLGYVESSNLVIEYGDAGWNFERLPALAAELVALKVDVIVAGNNAQIKAALRATRTIPIVMVHPTDPVGLGFVASLARPGGNITGLSLQSRDLSGKRLQLLKEVVPNLSRLAVLWDPANLGFRETVVKEAEVAAQALGMNVELFEVRSFSEIDNAFATMTRNGADSVFSPGGFYGARIIELAVKHHLPTTCGGPRSSEAGCLMFYGASFTDQYRRAATYVDKILKGAKPADLPVEQPTKFELVINLKTAKALGLTIPQTLLLRADQIIE
jgi:putative ABC transport system substrate-binding protein